MTHEVWPGVTTPSGPWTEPVRCRKDDQTCWAWDLYRNCSGRLRVTEMYPGIYAHFCDLDAHDPDGVVTQREVADR
jgi:hypothetical protein